jgi:NAD-dependent dihydropyrimidine dehydrogenase PreA subunit
MDDEARMIEVGGKEVGLVGLDELFVEMSERASKAEPGALRRELLEGVARRNYVPQGMEEAYADALYRAFTAFLEGESEPDRSGPTWRGIPRRHIEWYPRIDDGACDGCRKCLDFCSFGVFVFSSERGVVEVVSPYACVVGCSLCSSLCALRAISFPPLSYLDRFR